jgi:hypothetical protein
MALYHFIIAVLYSKLNYKSALYSKVLKTLVNCSNQQETLYIGLEMVPTVVIRLNMVPCFFA